VGGDPHVADIQSERSAESTAHAKPLQPLRLDLGVDGARDSHLNVMIRALIDHRLRRVCAIQAGMAAIAVTVAPHPVTQGRPRIPRRACGALALRLQRGEQLARLFGLGMLMHDRVERR
jgi:hypothetical protein